MLHLYSNVVGDGEKDYDSGLGEDVDFDAIVDERAFQEDAGDLDGEYENVEDGDFEDMVNIWAEMGGSASAEGKGRGNTFDATNGGSLEDTTETKTTTTLTRRREDDDVGGAADDRGSGGARKKNRRA